MTIHLLMIMEIGNGSVSMVLSVLHTALVEGKLPGAVLSFKIASVMCLACQLKFLEWLKPGSDGGAFLFQWSRLIHMSTWDLGLFCVNSLPSRWVKAGIARTGMF